MPIYEENSALVIVNVFFPNSFQLPLCQEYAIQINLPCLFYMEQRSHMPDHYTDKACNDLYLKTYTMLLTQIKDNPYRTTACFP